MARGERILQIITVYIHFMNRQKTKILDYLTTEILGSIIQASMKIHDNLWIFHEMRLLSSDVINSKF